MNLSPLIDLLFPERCVSCRIVVHDAASCKSCLEAVALHSSFFCGHCLARLPEARKICHFETPYILAAATDFSNPTARELIHTLKFKYIPAAARSLSRLIQKYLEPIAPEGFRRYLIVPVPLSARRMRSRGFNQSELIAACLAQAWSMDIDSTSLRREKFSKAQSLMKDFASRRTNVHGCFSALAQNIKGRNILLVDDVTTSGTTFEECARVLREAGARKIIAAAAAKAKT